MKKNKTYKHHYSANQNNAGIYSHITDRKPHRNTFVRDQKHLTTLAPGRVIPVYVDEVLPGDVMEVRISDILRLATPIVPTMDRIDVDFYAFFVPNRIVVWNWEMLMGQNDQSEWIQSSQGITAQAQLTNQTVICDNLGVDTLIAPCSIANYYGLPANRPYRSSLNPTGSTNSSLADTPFRGYYRIWNEWFRDENLVAPSPLGYSLSPTSSNPPLIRDFNIQQYPLRAMKKHDYFTSALPHSRRGYSPGQDPLPNFLLPFFMRSSHQPNLPFGVSPQDLATDVLGLQELNGVAGSVQNGSVAGMDSDTSSMHNFFQSLRNAGQLNKLLERESVSGGRYIETIHAHFGVRPHDYRLQRSEFLGHYGSKFHVCQVAQTSETDNTPQGNLSAYALHACDKQYLFKKHFVEHGFVHVMAVVRQRKTYQNGVERFFSRLSKFDYYFPEFGKIGSMPIYQSEINAVDMTLDNRFARGLLSSPETPPSRADVIFGVKEAFDEYRYKPSRVSGFMTSGVSGSKDFWHYADNYDISSNTVLSASFIFDNSDINIARTVAFQDATNQYFDMIEADITIHNKSHRKLPLSGTGGYVDHF